MNKWLLLIPFFLIFLSGCDWYNKNIKENEPFELSKEEQAEVVLPEVEAALLGDKVFRERVSAEGLLQPVRGIDIFALEGGKVSAIYKNPGDFVVEGQVILDLANPRLQFDLKKLELELQQLKARASTIQADLEKAEANSRYKKKQYDRLTRSYGTSETSVTPEQLDKAELEWKEAKAELEELKSFNRLVDTEMLSLESLVKAQEERVAQLSLQAPFSGYLSELSVNQGELVRQALSDSLSAALGRLVDTKQIKLVAKFPARVQSRLQKGTLVIVEVPASDTTAIETYIQQVGVGINEEDQTVSATILLDNPSGVLRPGLKATVTSVQSLEWKARAIPLTAVHNRETNPYIYVVVDNRLQQVPVKLGTASMTHVELLSPELPEGIQIVTERSPDLTAGMEIRTVD